MSRKLPPLNALRAFEAAARHSNFTKAADELHVTHGAVSQQIKVLEEYFRQPLFIRSKGKVTLNPAGEKLLPVIGDVLDRIERVSARLRDDTDNEVLTIHSTAAFAGQWLIPRLSSFQQRHPGITIRLSPSPTFAGFQDLEPDVAIRWGRQSFPGVVMEKLFDVDTFPACAPSLLEGSEALASVEDLARHRLIHDDDGEAWQALLDETVLAERDGGRDLYYADTLLALQAAVDGRGVIAAGSVNAAQHLASGHLVIPLDLIVPERNAYYLYTPEGRQDRAKLAAFHDWIMEQAEDWAANKTDLRGYFVQQG